MIRAACSRKRFPRLLRDSVPLKEQPTSKPQTQRRGNTSRALLEIASGSFALFKL